jgi:hypothetical protein
MCIYLHVLCKYVCDFCCFAVCISVMFTVHCHCMHTTLHLDILALYLISNDNGTIFATYMLCLVLHQYYVHCFLHLELCIDDSIGYALLSQRSTQQAVVAAWTTRDNNKDSSSIHAYEALHVCLRLFDVMSYSMSYTCYCCSALSFDCTLELLTVVCD